METAGPTDAPKKGFEGRPVWTYETDFIGIRHVSMSPTGQEIAVSQWDGNIQILSSRTGRISYTIPFINTDTVVSCTKFHPREKLIISCGTSGHVGLCLYQKNEFVWSTLELDTNTYACDFSSDGYTFATSGKDSAVRVYDTETHNLIICFDSEFEKHHTSRVYSVVYDRSDPSRLLTGGWDTRVLLWDTRAKLPVGHIGGPNICGDSVDIRGNEVITGSWRYAKPLELWDIRSPGSPVSTGEWGSSQICQIYSAKFCQSKGWVVAGGSEDHAVKAFATPKLESLARIGYFEGPVNSVIAADDGSLVVAASQDGKCCAFVNHQ